MSFEDFPSSLQKKGSTQFSVGIQSINWHSTREVHGAVDRRLKLTCPFLAPSSLLVLSLATRRALFSVKPGWLSGVTFGLAFTNLLYFLFSLFVLIYFSHYPYVLPYISISWFPVGYQFGQHYYCKSADIRISFKIGWTNGHLMVIYGNAVYRTANGIAVRPYRPWEGSIRPCRSVRRYQVANWQRRYFQRPVHSSKDYFLLSAFENLFRLIIGLTYNQHLLVLSSLDAYMK